MCIECIFRVYSYLASWVLINLVTKVQIIHHLLGVVLIIYGFLTGFRSTSPCLQKKRDKVYADTHLHVIPCTPDHSNNTTG